MSIQFQFLLVTTDYSLVRQMTELIASKRIEAHLHVENNPRDAGKKIQKHFFHLFLLDDNAASLHSPETDDLAYEIRMIHKKSPLFIFSEHYSEERYDALQRLAPMIFLPKPVERLELLQAVELTLLQISLPPARASRPHSFPSPARAYPTHVFIKKDAEFHKVCWQDIICFQSLNKSTLVNTASRIYQINTSLNELEGKFNQIFIRVHKQYLINSIYIDSVCFKTARLTAGNLTFPVGKAYAKNLRTHMAASP